MKRLTGCSEMFLNIGKISTRIRVFLKDGLIFCVYFQMLKMTSE